MLTIRKQYMELQKKSTYPEKKVILCQFKTDIQVLHKI